MTPRRGASRSRWSSPRAARGAAGARESHEVAIALGTEELRARVEVVAGPTVALVGTERGERRAAGDRARRGATVLRVAGQNLDGLRLDCAPLGAGASCRTLGATPAELVTEVVPGAATREGEHLLPLVSAGRRPRTAGTGLGAERARARRAAGGAALARGGRAAARGVRRRRVPHGARRGLARGARGRRGAPRARARRGGGAGGARLAAARGDGDAPARRPAAGGADARIVRRAAVVPPRARGAADGAAGRGRRRAPRRRAGGAGEHALEQYPALGSAVAAAVEPLVRTSTSTAARSPARRRRVGAAGALQLRGRVREASGAGGGGRPRRRSSRCT